MLLSGSSQCKRDNRERLSKQLGGWCYELLSPAANPGTFKYNKCLSSQIRFLRCKASSCSSLVLPCRVFAVYLPGLCCVFAVSLLCQKQVFSIQKECGSCEMKQKWFSNWKCEHELLQILKNIILHKPCLSKTKWQFLFYIHPVITPQNISDKNCHGTECNYHFT